MNQTNKKIIDDEITKLEKELKLDENYLKQIYDMEVDEQWKGLRETEGTLNDIIRSSSSVKNSSTDAAAQEGDSPDETS